MSLNNDIFVLDENLISETTEERPEKPDNEGGLVEQVVKEERPVEKKKKKIERRLEDLEKVEQKNPKLVGDDEIEITESPFIIGKYKTADFTIEGDTYISRKHCRIVKRQDEYFIEDLNSTNGTYVDGMPISEKTKLINGQEIKLADRNYTWVE